MGIKTALTAMKAALQRPVVPLEQRFANTNAPAITNADIDRAAAELGVTAAHIRMVRAVESGGKSFDDRGRPVILFEPHIFHRRTGGKFSPASYSYSAWGARPYPKGYDARWAQMAAAAAKDEVAALESASWGLFQIMGFHWKQLGYASVQDFVQAMVASEAGHLDAMVRFIRANGLVAPLRQCAPGDAESCRDFARGYNGGGYARNSYHVKLAKALA
jgi:hypothetical protein